MHVHVNAATSADGKLSTRAREQVAISGPEDFERVDRIRARSDAVMVGVGTVLADDPSLTVKSAERRQEREARGDPQNPARVIADSRARTPVDAEIVDGTARTYLLVSETAPAERRDALMRRPQVTAIEAGAERVDLTRALDRLADHGVERLMVEGGGELIAGLFEADRVDEVTQFVGPMVIGGREAPTLVDGEGVVDPEAFPRLSLAAVDRLDGGVVLSWTVD
jgi:2,5-diamino-6-(5-phosphoribosylamino)pyrimidin-4(3H)-one reductase (EC 1.1.1.-)